jgi:hypothetical protein
MALAWAVAAASASPTTETKKEFFVKMIYSSGPLRTVQSEE